MFTVGPGSLLTPRIVPIIRQVKILDTQRVRICRNWPVLLWFLLPSVLTAQMLDVPPRFPPNATAEERSWVAAVEKKAAAGSAEAQYELSKTYMEGRIVKQDVAQAVRWVHAAAEQGLPEAEVNLGLLYHSGTGVPLDYSQCLYWMQKAANQGNVKAEYNMGVIFVYGQGVQKDLPQAIRWYTKAAEQGHQLAAYNVGLAYSLGVGVAPDEVKGYMWQYLAATHFDYAPSRKALKSLSAKLDQAQIAKARRESDEWIRTHPNVKPVAP